MKTTFRLRLLTLALLTSGAVLAQVRPGPPGPPNPPPGQLGQPNPPAQAGFGQPLQGLTENELALFRQGRASFLEVETPEEGLGPIFNGRSCVQCHGVPAAGGSSPINVTRFGRVQNGVFDPLTALGGSLLQRFSIDPDVREVIPREANVVAERESTALFGLGLIEAIPDAAILANATTTKPDGIRGRAAIINDVTDGQMRVGRFGWKAQHATLLAFSGDAYRNEMGITNDLFDEELAVGIDATRMRGCDAIPGTEDVRDPLTRRRGIDNFASFMRLLAPIDRAAGDALTRDGERVFQAIGCAACHVPALVTAPSRSPLFDRRPVPLFSDLLLHDVGTGDEIRQAAAEPNEIRTPALWGLRHRRPLLHDGSAATIADAILRHGREAGRARAGFDRLGDDERTALLAFLGTL